MSPCQHVAAGGRPARAEGEELVQWAEKLTKASEIEASEVADALATMERRLGIEPDEDE